MNGLTDIHQHLLWGVDDGPQTREEMKALLREAHDQQIRRIFATAHAYPGYQPFDAPLYAQRLSEAQAYCHERDWDISILPGAEIAWTYHTVEALHRKQLPTLNGTDYVLIELSENVLFGEVRSATEQILRAGFLPILAHVERYRCFVWNPERAMRLRDALPVCYQVDAQAVLQKGGLMLNRFMDCMLRHQAIDAVASDAHDCHARPQCLAQAFEALRTRCGEAYAQSLLSFDETMKQ